MTVRYRSAEEDSTRWTGFPFRDGDIVISTRSKSGSTWVQNICALLIFQTPDLPAPLTELSPWLDWTFADRGDVYRHLADQEHRRFIKTHTPLDGIPVDPRATYVVVARHPLDIAVSMYHQGANIDRARVRELMGRPGPGRPAPPDLAPHDWLMRWIHSDVGPRQRLDSLRGVMWHFSGAWSRRDRPNVVLMHYNDLLTDLGHEMRRLAGRLGIVVPDHVWPALVKAATFDQMRERADGLVPDPLGFFVNKQAFFRRGRSGSGRELLTSEEYASYLARTARMAPADLLDWLHRES